MPKQSGKKKAALLSVFAAVFLTAFKVVVGVSTGSLGILSEALHSTLDLVAALITWFAVRISDKPADRDHNFGHGKVENLSALFETLLLFATCFWIVYEAVCRLVSGGVSIEVGFWSYAVVITSILVDLNRSRVLKHAAKKYKSEALEADALHFSTDIWSSVVVLVGLVLSSFEIYAADSIAALCVAFVVMLVSYRLGKRSVFALIDGVSERTRKEVCEVIESVDGVKRFHSLRVRSAGPETFVEVNIHVSPNLSIVEAHDISTNVEYALRKHFGKCMINVHIEPDSH